MLEGSLLCAGIDLGMDAEAWREVAQPWATRGEWAFAQRFHHRIDGTCHLAGRAMVRSLLARQGAAAAPAEFTPNPWGKPTWPGCGFEFSISHSGHAVWVALCRGTAVGIDVETTSAEFEPGTLAGCLHPREQSALAGLPGAQARAAFLRCWTRKEAVLKAMGEGLARPLASFQVWTDERPCDWLAQAPPAEVAGWTTADLPGGDGHQVSVAAQAPGLRITCRQLERSALGSLRSPW
jgi:4'-phosphopantetheinyl transferase